MTKECHFPGDEGANNVEIPQTAASAAVSDRKPIVAFQTPIPPSFDDYDEDFDFRPQYPYPSKRGLVDRMETKPSNDRRSYADNPIFRKDNSEFAPKEDFGFDSHFYDFNEENKKQMKRRPKPKKSRPQMSSSPSDGYDFDDEDFGPQPRKSRKNLGPKGQPLYRNDRESGGAGGGRGGGKGGPQKGAKKKPKKINRSFAFFRKREPKDKDPNESDYAVSYGRGNFQSFSDSYDSDRDGPRKKGQGMKRSRSRDDDDEDD